MEVFVFSKPGFKAWQSEKLRTANRRGAILVDTHICNDSKMMLLHEQQDYTLFALYIHILGKLDLETETWEIRADEFKSWFKKTFGVNNRFDILKRLKWFSNVGLIAFKRVPNDSLMTSEHASNDLLMTSERLPNVGNNEEVYPLEPAETRVALRATITNKQTNQETNKRQKSSPKISFSDADAEAAQFIAEKIKALDPTFEPKSPNGWANTIRLMREQDGRSHDAIKELYSWVISDPFWRKNVLSPDKLREKWTQLTLSKQHTHAKSPPLGAVPGNRIVPHNERKGGVIKL